MREGKIIVSDNAQTGPTLLGFPASSPAGLQVTAGTEVAPDFPRVWVEFSDPDDPQRMFKADLTWLSSRWQCTFGSSCAGIVASSPDVGCCVHGAFLADADDRAALEKAVAQMPSTFWQLHDLPVADPDLELPFYLVWDELDNDEGEPEPAVKTRVVNGACIFANRAGSLQGAGCALHQWAIATGQPLTEVKPEVCWQLPIHRHDEWTTRPDGAEILVTTIGEYDRRAWGWGGEDFSWYCSGSPNCHTASTPLVDRYEQELVALIGLKPYKILKEYVHNAAAGLPAHPATQTHLDQIKDVL